MSARKVFSKIATPEHDVRFVTFAIRAQNKKPKNTQDMACGNPFFDTNAEKANKGPNIRLVKCHFRDSERTWEECEVDRRKFVKYLYVV